MSNWYYQLMGEELGPYSDHQLRELAWDGTIGGDTLVRKGVDGRWVMATSVRGLISSDPPVRATDQQDNASASVPVASQTCPKCGSSYTAYTTDTVCVNCNYDSRPTTNNLGNSQSTRETQTAISFVTDAAAMWRDALLFRSEDAGPVYRVIMAYFVANVCITICWLVNSGQELRVVPTLLTLGVQLLICVVLITLSVAMEYVFFGITYLITFLQLPAAENAMTAVWKLLIWNSVLTVLFVGPILLGARPSSDAMGAILFVYVVVPAYIYSTEFSVSLRRALLLASTQFALRACGLFALFAGLPLLARFIRDLP